MADVSCWRRENRHRNERELLSKMELGGPLL